MKITKHILYNKLVICKDLYMYGTLFLKMETLIAQGTNDT